MAPVSDQIYCGPDFHHDETNIISALMSLGSLLFLRGMGVVSKGIIFVSETCNTLDT
jgi:hypothetical protein